MSNDYYVLDACRTVIGNVPEETSRILFCGEDNPQSTELRHALYPYPPGCAGERLCNSILDLPTASYLAIWRTNLCPDGRWSWPKARARALLLVERTVGDDAAPWDTIVMMGKKVAECFHDALGFEGELMKPLTTRRSCPGVTLAYVPHPSGRNRFYNVKGAAENVQAFVRSLSPSLWE